jgi:hypothetical protein
MIENGLYKMDFRATDGVDAIGSSVIVLRDGIILGGNSYFYYVGTYSCFEGTWKGELTIQEHAAAPINQPMAGKIVSAGFSGTYSGSCGAAGGHLSRKGQSHSRARWVRRSRVVTGFQRVRDMSNCGLCSE